MRSMVEGAAACAEACSRILRYSQGVGEVSRERVTEQPCQRVRVCQG